MIYGTFIEAQGEFARQITFLSRAVCKDRSRYFMCHILIEPSDVEPGKLRGVSTDGRRLHIVDPLLCPDGMGLEPGNWRPLKMGGETSWIAQIKSDEGRFPNYRKVIPTGEPLFTFDLPGLPRGDLTENMPYLVKFFREFPEPTAINMNYINSLDHSVVWKVKWYDGDKTVLFESAKGPYTAIIMPIYMKENNEHRKAVGFFGKERGSGADLSVFEMDLVLPEADINGLHFNEQKVHGVFEKQDDDRYYSRDILFLSARDTNEETGRDILSEYLESDAVKEAFCACLDTDSESYFSRIKISLPEKNQGIKKYNGVSCWYWLRPRSSGSAAYFAYVYTGGNTANGGASAVGGCAPAFCIRWKKEETQ